MGLQSILVKPFLKNALKITPYDEEIIVIQSGLNHPQANGDNFLGSKEDGSICGGVSAVAEDGSFLPEVVPVCLISTACVFLAKR